MVKINIDDSGIDDFKHSKNHGKNKKTDFEDTCAKTPVSDELNDIHQFDSLYEQGKGKSFEENVYMPQDDTYLLCDAVDEFAKGKVLEIGCGSGFISIEAAKNGHEVTCVDINPYAIEYTKKLAEEEKVKIECFESDLFEKVVDEYDTIIFNPPYLPKDDREPNDLITVATTGGEQGYELIERFFSDVDNYLKKEGNILLLFSSLTKKEKVDELIALYGFKAEKIRESKFFFEKLYVYLIKRI